MTLTFPVGHSVSGRGQVGGRPGVAFGLPERDVTPRWGCVAGSWACSSTGGGGVIVPVNPGAS